MNIKSIQQARIEELLAPLFAQEVDEFGRDMARNNPAGALKVYLELKQRLQEVPEFQSSAVRQVYMKLLERLRLVCMPYLGIGELFDFVKNDYIKSCVQDSDFDLTVNDRIEGNLLLSFEYENVQKTQEIITALKNNDEPLGSKQLVVTNLGRNAAPICKNWILDYDQTFGVDPQPSTSIATYINQNSNAKFLNSKEISILKSLLQLYEEMKMLNFVAKNPDLIAAYQEYSEQKNKTKGEAAINTNAQVQQERLARAVSSRVQQTQVRKVENAVPPSAVALPPFLPKTQIPARPAAAVPALAPVKTPNSTPAPTPPSAPAEIIPYYATTIVEKIIRAERLAKLSDEQKKRLELIIGQVLRELKTKEDAARTLEASIEQGGVGFAKNQAQRIAGLIVPFAAEARQAVINNNLQKRSLSQQKLRQVGMEINEELEGGKVAPQKTSAPAPSVSASATQSKPAPSATPSQAPAAPATPKNPLTLTRSQDLMQITIAQLRGTSAQAAPSATLAFAANVQTVATQVRAVIAGKQAEPRQLLAFWRQSEPFKTYQEIGRESITTKKPVGAIARERAAARKPYLTEQEFVAVADFTKELQTAAV